MIATNAVEIDGDGARAEGDGWYNGMKDTRRSHELPFASQKRFIFFIYMLDQIKVQIVFVQAVTNLYYTFIIQLALL